MCWSISKPVHSDTSTVWYVRDDVGVCKGVLEIGQLYDTVEGATYKLVSVTWHTGYVLVERCDRHYSDRSLWRVESLLNRGQKLREVCHVAE